MFWGWSPAAGGALTAVRLVRLGAVAMASDGLRPAAAVVVQVVRAELVPSCPRLVAEASAWLRGSLPGNWSSFRPGGGSGVFVRLGVFSDTAGAGAGRRILSSGILHCTPLGWVLNSPSGILLILSWSVSSPPIYVF